MLNNESRQEKAVAVGEMRFGAEVGPRAASSIREFGGAVTLWKADLKVDKRERDHGFRVEKAAL